MGRVPDADHVATLVRDPSTVLSYGLLGAFAFWLYAFGPAVALLRTEIGFSYAVVGVYSATWALGSTVVSAVYPPLVARTGHWWMLWGSSAATALGAVLFMLAHDIAWTLVGGAVLGTAGTAMQLAVQSVLSERHGERRGQALVEANVGAGACAVLAPLALGGLAATAAGWRSAMALPLLALAVLFVVYRRYPGIEDGRRPGGRGAAGQAGPRRPGLSAECWILCFLVGVAVAVEFCVIYFGAELLTARTSLSPTGAATAMTAFYAGILAGRIGGARIVRTPGRSMATLWVSVLLSMGGLLMMMVGSGLAVGLAGILVAGIGVANLFPLSLSLALGAAGPRTEVANGLAQVIGGILVIVAPFFLGALADSIGLTGAFAITPALALACGALLVAGHVASGRSTTRPNSVLEPSAAPGATSPPGPTVPGDPATHRAALPADRTAAT